MRDLRIAVIDALGYQTNKDMDLVKIYTAVGSPLDVWHSVDLFIEVEDKNHLSSKIVNFDFKAGIESGDAEEEQRQHVHEAKADILIFAKDIPDAETESKKYIAKMDEIARKVAEILQTRMPAAA